MIAYPYKANTAGEVALGLPRLELDHYDRSVEPASMYDVRRTSFCPLLIHYTMSALSTPDGFPRLDFVFGTTI